MIDTIIKYWKSDLSNMNLIIKKFTKKQKLEFWSYFLVLIVLMLTFFFVGLYMKDTNLKFLLFFIILAIILTKILFWLVDRNSKLMYSVIKSNYGHLSLTKYTFSELKSTLIIKKCEELQVENYKELLDALRYREQRWILIYFTSFIAFLSFFSDIISDYFNNKIKIFEKISTAFVVFTIIKIVYFILVIVIVIMIYYFCNNFLIHLQKVIKNYLIKKKN